MDKNILALSLLILFLGSSTRVIAQGYTSALECKAYCMPQRTENRRNMYLEGLGVAGLGSFNFEFIFVRRNRFQLLFRPGIGVQTPASDKVLINVPIMAHILAGGKSHYLDFGVGEMPGISTKGEFSIQTPFSVGYRLSPMKRGFFCRIAYTPRMSYIGGFKYEHWAGLAVGIKLITYR